MDLILCLVFLMIKHWYIDFVNQSSKEIANKGKYLNWTGMQHSLKHGIATASVFAFFAPSGLAIILGLLDFALHYHIDWIKMNYGCQDMKQKEFWHHLGLDQLAHNLTYIILIAMTGSV